MKLTPTQIKSISRILDGSTPTERDGQYTFPIDSAINSYRIGLVADIAKEADWCAATVVCIQDDLHLNIVIS